MRRCRVRGRSLVERSGTRRDVSWPVGVVGSDSELSSSDDEESVAVAVEARADDAKGETCYI